MKLTDLGSYIHARRTILPIARMVKAGVTGFIYKSSQEQLDASGNGVSTLLSIQQSRDQGAKSISY